MSASINLIRSISILLLLIISVILGILPSKLKIFTSNPKLIAYVNSFSAGLFLGLGLIHLLPESMLDYEQYIKREPNERAFPISFGICILSFSVILFIERVLFQAHSFIHLHADTHSELELEGKSHASDDIGFNEPLIGSLTTLKAVCDADKEEETFKKLISTKEKVARTTIDKEFHRNEIRKEHNLMTVSTPNLNKQIANIHNGPPTSPYAILLALSIHGIFEGVAVGIQNNETQALNLVLAVLLHKWAEALTLGVALYRGNLSFKTTVAQILLFSFAGPLGIAIGWIMSSSSLLISAIFKAISAGTFLYVAATELVVEEFSISTNMYSKFSVYLFALAAVSGLVIAE